MSDPVLDEARLAAIQAAAEKATPGPWHWTPEESGWTDCGPNLESTTATSCAADERPEPREELAKLGDWWFTQYPVTVVGSWGHDAWGITVGSADAEFIALARSAVPELLAHVGVLRADNQRLREQLAGMTGQRNYWARLTDLLETHLLHPEH